MAKGSYEDTFTKYREQFEQKLDAIREQILQKAEEDISEGAGDDEEVDVSEAEEILIDFDDAYRSTDGARCYARSNITARLGGSRYGL